MNACDASSPADGRRLQRRLGILVVAWGVLAIVTQSILLREAIVLMSGSEIAWGVMLFAWLLGVAVGAWTGGTAARRIGRPDGTLVVVLVGLGVVACGELWAFRGARAWLGIAPGELLPLGKATWAALLWMSPAGALVGAAFPLACAVVGRGAAAETQGVGPLSGVYALESLGSLLGGAAFSFWAVEHLAPIQTLLLCTAITAAAGAWLLSHTRNSTRPAYGGRASGFIAAVMLALCIFAGGELDHRLIQRRWRNIAAGYELIAQAESKHQNLAVGRRLGLCTLYCDGQVAVSFPDPYAFAPLAHFWMCQHPEPRRVLVLGGGAEGLLSEMLLHPVEQVDYVEADPQRIALIEPFLAEADRAALKDPRVTVHHVDARYFVKTRRDLYDLVIASLPEPTSVLRARLYTDAFYRELRGAMTERSVLCMTAAATPADLPAAAADYLASIRRTLHRHFPQITIGNGDPAHILAATATGLVTTEPAELMGRYARRGVTSSMFHPAWFEDAVDWLDADKLAARSAQLDEATNVEISTDLRPAITLQRLALWEQIADGQAGRVIGRLRSIGWSPLAIALAVVAVATLLFCRARHGRETGGSAGAVTLSIGATGFATMSLSIIWLFAFQNLYGYVYQRIGWIIALFMAGLVTGCHLAGVWTTRRSPSWDSHGLAAFLRKRLIAVDVLLALLALSVPLVLPALGDLQNTATAMTLVEWTISIMVILTGLLCGSAFVWAAALQHNATGRAATVAGKAAAVAGNIVGADHAGACLGALLTGVLLVPVFGITTSAYLLAAIKLATAGVLIACKTRSPCQVRTNTR